MPARARFACRAKSQLFSIFSPGSSVAWLISTAYKPGRDIFSIPPTLTFSPTLDNFRSVFRYFDLFHLVESSLVISLCSAALSLLIGVPAGYALARAQTRWAVGIAYFFLAVRTVPPVATLLPFYMMMRDIGLLGTWWAVILLGTTLNTAFVVWMMFSYFRSLPKEMEEAALTDGCTLFGSFRRVALPMVKPGMVASALLCIMFAWNDFLYSAFLKHLPVVDPATVPVDLAFLVDLDGDVLRLGLRRNVVRLRDRHDRLFDHGHRDQKDDQQHQHDVHQRSRIDIRDGSGFAVVTA
jgi:multiple sugar transport system permease protein